MQLGSYNNLVLQEAPVAPPKSNEVLVKTHAVSLQVFPFFARFSFRDPAIRTVPGPHDRQRDIPRQVRSTHFPRAGPLMAVFAVRHRIWCRAPIWPEK
jgi:hypothetical protein